MAVHSKRTRDYREHVWYLPVPIDHGEMFKMLYAARSEVAALLGVTDGELSDDILRVNVTDDEVTLTYVERK